MIALDIFHLSVNNNNDNNNNFFTDKVSPVLAVIWYS